MGFLDKFKKNKKKKEDKKGICDVCASPGMGTLISSDQMRKAVSNGFNPFKLNLAHASLPKEEQFIYWKNTLVLQDTSDWNICNKCSVHISKYLNEAPKPKNIDNSYSDHTVKDPLTAELIRRFNEEGLMDDIVKKQKK